MIFASLWPVFALLIVGVLCRRTQFPGDAFWPLVEKLIYYVCFPALLIVRLAAADFTGGSALKLIPAVLLLLAVGTVLIFAVQRLIGFKPASFTSIFQGGMRFNTYIALSIAAALLPERGLIYSAIIVSVMIPILNVLSVSVFALYQENRPSPMRVLLNIAQNPLILGCVIGLILNLSGLGLHWTLNSVLELLASVALPLGLLAVGAALDLRALRTAGLALGVSVSFRLLLMPLIVVPVGWMFELSLEAFTALVIFSAVPTASAAYILARQLGGDAPLMSGIISAQVLVSMLTLPLLLAWLPLLYLS